MTKKFVLLDIDGCILDLSARWNALRSKEIDYATYLERTADDVPIPAGVALYEALLCAPHLIPLFVTAREEHQRSATRMRLRELFPEHGIACLLMRPNGEEYTPLTKVRILKKADIKPADVAFAIDDDPRMVAGYASIGIVCYMAPGVE